MFFLSRTFYSMRDGNNNMRPPVKAGEKEDIFKELLSYRESVFLVCLGYTRNYDEAEELTQDIYVKAWEKLDLIDRKTSAKGWIITIARNRCIDHFRKTKIRNLFLSKKGHEGHSTIDENTPEEIIIFESDKSKLKKCVWSLPEKLRSVFILKEYSGNSCEEISELLQVKLGTVHSRLNRGREKVTKLMEVLNG